jgi:molybdopterin-guanine dinucleotide biosynthesis protein A
LNIFAVVLAGGDSRRFGSDKLAAALGQQTLLDHTLAALPEAFTVIVVGPERPTARPVTFTREQPPGGGPAAALVAGVRVALTSEPDAIVVLPGDAPAAGRGAMTLVAALAESPVAVGVDATGQWQPLQLALRPAAGRQLLELAGPDGAVGQPARRLLTRLDPPPQPVTLEPAALFDIDTPDALREYLSSAHLSPTDRPEHG